uniref:UspA domain-containing protein n=1 Tax=Aegilops tauschii subsp. strangulata TaxID=200361 RepID=A0A452ZGS0_AEGTS
RPAPAPAASPRPPLPRRRRPCAWRRRRRRPSRRSSPARRATSSPPSRPPPRRTAASPSPSTCPTSPPSPSSGPCRTTCARATPSCSCTCAPPPCSTAPTGAPSPSPSTTATDARKKREEDFDAFTSTKSQDLAQPLVAAQIPFKIHIVKDHDMKERLCLEAERLGLSAMIMGSRGFGASRRAGNGRLGSVSDYCVHHCVCPVVVVRYPDDAGAAGGAESVGDELRTVPENEVVFHEAPEGQKECI